MSPFSKRFAFLQAVPMPTPPLPSLPPPPPSSPWVLASLQVPEAGRRHLHCHRRFHRRRAEYQQTTKGYSQDQIWIKTVRAVQDDAEIETEHSDKTPLALL